jgi:hypothetical protein
MRAASISTLRSFGDPNVRQLEPDFGLDHPSRCASTFSLNRFSIQSAAHRGPCCRVALINGLRSCSAAFASLLGYRLPRESILSWCYRLRRPHVGQLQLWADAFDGGSFHLGAKRRPIRAHDATSQNPRSRFWHRAILEIVWRGGGCLQKPAGAAAQSSTFHQVPPASARPANMSTTLHQKVHSTPSRSARTRGGGGRYPR